MQVSGWLAIFVVGCLGGIVAEIGRWYELRTSPNLPDYARHWLYWIITMAMVLAGGFLAVVYGTDAKNSILVVNIGLSAPLIIKGLAAANPVRPGSLFVAAKPKPFVIRFLAGK